MNIVVLAHPAFLDSTSMPLFANMLSSGLTAHGHEVRQWSPRAMFHRLPAPRQLRKWLGYLDQFLVFPWVVRRRLRRMPPDTLFVFSDQALGPWVPLVAHRPHVIHCHDFMALRSALGEFPQNPVSWTGKLYQRFIRAGFRKGRNFISVSERTRTDLHRFLDKVKPERSIVVHNGLNHPYRPLPMDEAQARLQSVDIPRPEGFILHVGGNQWYKNRGGVVDIYAAYARQVAEPLPLLMLGAAPDDALRAAARRVSEPAKVEFVVRPPTDILEAAYSAASVLLFPSCAEGFGWPIIEAMACGCPVLTTDDAPMTEVGGDVADYLPKPPSAGDRTAWADACAVRLIDVLSRSASERDARRQAGIARAQGFDAENTLQRYLDVYAQVLESGNR